MLDTFTDKFSTLFNMFDTIFYMLDTSFDMFGALFNMFNTLCNMFYMLFSTCSTQRTGKLLGCGPPRSHPARFGMLSPLPGAYWQGC